MKSQSGSPYDASLWLDPAGEDVDGHDVRRLVVPRAVLPPVRGGNLLPRVVEGALGREDLHRVENRDRRNRTRYGRTFDGQNSSSANAGSLGSFFFSFQPVLSQQHHRTSQLDSPLELRV